MPCHLTSPHPSCNSTFGCHQSLCLNYDVWLWLNGVVYVISHKSVDRVCLTALTEPLCLSYIQAAVVLCRPADSSLCTQCHRGKLTLEAKFPSLDARVNFHLIVFQCKNSLIELLVCGFSLLVIVRLM